MGWGNLLGYMFSFLFTQDNVTNESFSTRALKTRSQTLSAIFLKTYLKAVCSNFIIARGVETNTQMQGELKNALVTENNI